LKRLAVQIERGNSAALAWEQSVDDALDHGGGDGDDDDDDVDDDDDDDDDDVDDDDDDETRVAVSMSDEAQAALASCATTQVVLCKLKS
jgi:hypothetical protein